MRLNLNSAVELGGASSFWREEQGATTRDATAQGGAVPSAEMCGPESGMRPMRVERDRGPLRCPIPASRSPLVRRFRAPLHSKELQLNPVLQKTEFLTLPYKVK
jgi:hypothetical protein